MEQICPPDHCTGCAACLSVCPTDAITFREEGVGGYLHPLIDPARCIDCHLCEKTCPVNHPVTYHEPLTAFAAVNADDADLLASASGGASAILMRVVIARGGVAYGAVMESYRSVRHRRIDRLEDVALTRGSKYVQSEMGDTFRLVREDLRAGREVIFTGTPCQIGGLRNYLRRDYDNLYLVDLVCHGVPSIRLLRDQVEQQLQTRGLTPSDDIGVTFRLKPTVRSSQGVQQHNRTAAFKPQYGVFLVQNDSVLRPKRSELFLHNGYITAFMAGLIFRENCYTCPYAQPRRASDITIADYWGLPADSSIPASQGVSLLLPSTPRGLSLIRSVDPVVWKLEERSAQEAIEGNGQLRTHSVADPNRTAFFGLYPRIGLRAYDRCLKYYRRVYRRRQLAAAFRHCCPKLFGLLFRLKKKGLL